LTFIVGLAKDIKNGASFEHRKLPKLQKFSEFLRKIQEPPVLNKKPSPASRTPKKDELIDE
jgi:hypothetical protein